MEIQGMRDLVRSELEESASVTGSVDPEAVVRIAELLAEVFRSKHKVMLFGNGGSAADAQHIAAEFSGKYLFDRDPLNAVALTNLSSVTAIGNDYSYDDVFERQVRAGVEAYRSVYDRLGLSYIILQRPDFDKFAGAVYSLAFDAWNPDGKVNQIGTVHQLGHNFAKAFDLTYEDEDGKQVHAATTCYGMGFGRVLAAVISQHGDDHGIILPPIVAPKQVVIVPIPIKGKEAETKRYATKVAKTLKKAGVRVMLDDDDRLRPGEKFYKWEMYGVPLRIEIGPREAKSNTVTIVRRDTFEKVKTDLTQLVPTVHSLFDAIFENLSDMSRKYMEGTIIDVKTVDELYKQIEERKIARINWCGDRQCADNLKEKVSGEVRGTLWGTEEQPDGPCILCGDPAKSVAYFSRAY